MSYPVVQLAIATVLIIAAAAADLRGRRIPNSINGALLIAGVVAQATAHGGASVISGLAAALLMAGALWHPWQKGRIGGGDVKMAAAAACWVGLGRLVPYALATALAGGGVAVVCAALSSRQARAEMRAGLTLAAVGGPAPSIKGAPGRVSVPYGVAVGLGALAVLWGAGIW